MMLRNALAAAVAILLPALGAPGASAQQQPAEEGPLLIAGTVDCRYQLRPVEAAICATPVLAAMDLQMVTLFNTLNLLVKPEVGVEMAGAQQAFMKAREACGTDATCIGETTARRIEELDVILRDIASRGPY